ncbi:MAG: GGDEF domain-containing protein [Rhodocyclaceae bacterium]|nr:GGDEF domain-containing protein [Rhodocyclaceae bacterium]
MTPFQPAGHDDAAAVQLAALTGMRRGTGDERSPSRLALDGAGRIVFESPEWGDFVARVAPGNTNLRMGGDYLSACRSGWNGQVPEMLAHARDLSEILASQCARVAGVVYGCRPEGSRRWFRATAIPLAPLATDQLLIVHEDVSREVESREQLARKAFVDAVTELPNYALFSDRLALAVTQKRRGGPDFAVMFIDLNAFKAINDTFGHVTGNMVLKEVGGRLRESLRDGDTVARLGGDEFGILLPGVGAREAASRVADKIRRRLASPFLAWDGSEFTAAASIGVAFCPRDGIDPTALVERADRDMYRLKPHGARRGRGSAIGLRLMSGSQTG